MQRIAATYLSLLLVLGAAAQELPYSVCSGCWNADSLGNQRIVVRYRGSGVAGGGSGVARVVILWRRRDEDAGKKRIIVLDSATGERVRNVWVRSVTREVGDICFEPVSGKGIYYVYYMPYRNEGRSNYPKGVYWRQDTTAATGWMEKAAVAGSGGVWGKAIAVGIQAIDSFNSVYPMEVVATAKEVAALKAKYKDSAFLVFPEGRAYPIRMRRDLPYRWIVRGPGGRAGGATALFENYAYELGLYALRSVSNARVEFGSLRNGKGQVITGDSMVCINTDGISYDGRAFIKRVDVPEGEVQALWCVVRVPGDASGIYTGAVSVVADGRRVAVPVRLKVERGMAVDHGVGTPAAMTRLQWLNSTLAQENTVIAPYTPLEMVGDTVIRLLGRSIRLGRQGFPEQIQTFFTPEMTEMTDKATNLLAEGIHFHFVRQVQGKDGPASEGKDIRLNPGGVRFVERTPGTVRWEAVNASDTLKMEVSAALEFDGFLSYTVKVIALADVDLKDIVLHIPFQPEAAKYMMGLGRTGGYRPDSLFRWKWDVAHKNQDGAWIGTVNAGLQYSLRDEHYVRPLNTNFYLQKPLIAPSSWANGDKGGIDVGIKGRSMLANNYSGPRRMRKGDTLYYNFNLLVTPFHVLNTDFQWATRFYHRYNNLDSIKATGATVVNIHHATPINPWINYPFIEWRRMKAYVDSAHRLGLKVKIYNTVRELSDHAYELFALRSLGSEIYSPGRGGGFSWLQEHVADNYIPAWFVPEIKDAAMINSGTEGGGRWHNYYVEGMNWLVQNVGIDGIYLDDVAFDRVTMKRIKRVLSADGHPGIIDLHSANQYNPRDGYNNSANLYMEHFPYLNRLWFGEYFDYEHNTPDFFLTEVSGIPFGLMGEMLEGGGNPWRGMIYGMTNRMPWTDNADPRPIWKVWDAFGMQGTKMIGYWSPSCPVKTDNAAVLGTVYQKKGAALVSLASWAGQDTAVRLHIDWKALGIDPAHGVVEAPEIRDFQPARTFGIDEAIPVEKGKGWMLIIRGGE
jgi:hypothetical protein